MKLDGRRMSDNISDRRGERMNMAGGGMGLLRLLAILPGGIKTKLIGLAERKSTGYHVFAGN